MNRSKRSPKNRTAKGPLVQKHKEVAVRIKAVRYGIVLLGAMLMLGFAGAQPLPVRLYGGNQSEQCHALVEGVDPGFCLAGWTRSYGSGAPARTNVLVVKTDLNGTPLWSLVSQGAHDDEAYSMVRTHNNQYVITGWTRSYGIGTPQNNVFVIKLDQFGNQLWGRVYGGTADDEAYSIIETADAGYAITGRTWSYGPSPRPNVFVMKLDYNGVLQWMRVYWMWPNHMEDEGYSIVQTADTGFAVVGRAKTTGPAFFNPFVMKLDKAGQIQWVLTVPGAGGDDEAYSVAVDLQANICVAGLTQSFGTNPGNRDDMFVAQFTMTGFPIYSHTYGWPNGDEQVLDDRSLVATHDAGLAVCGPTTSVGPGIPNPNFLILKLDPSGFPMWCRSHPSPYDPGLLSDVPLPMIQQQNRGYAVAGWTDSYSHLGGGDDFHLATIDSMGNRPVCVQPQEPDMDTMPWIEWYMADSLYYAEYDSMPLVMVDILFDSICYDSSPQRIEERSDQKGTDADRLRLRSFGNRIELSLGVAAQVELAVFTTDGRKLTVLADRKFAAGVHEFSLPVGIPAGAYLVQAAGNGCGLATKAVKF